MLVIMILYVYYKIYNKSCGCHNIELFQPTQLREIIENIPKNRIVLYFAPWCHYCKEMLPIWKQFIGKLDESKLPIIYDKVNCSDNAQTCIEEHVEGYPTVILYINNKRILFDGQRTVGGLMDFVMKNLPR